MFHMVPLAVLLIAGLTSAQEASVNTTTNFNATEAPVQNVTIASLNQINENLKISLKSIPSLVFKAGRFTTRIRTTPVPQLNCISGCDSDLPSSAICNNKGFDGLNVNWECTANIKKGRKLENTRVRCEAFTEGDREFIVAGSCGLDYSLGGRTSGSSRGKGYYSPSFNSGQNPKGPLQYIIPVAMVIIVAILVCTVIAACKRKNESSGVVIGAPAGQPGYYGGGGGAYPAQPGFNPGYGGAPGYGHPPVAVPTIGGGGTSALGAGVGGFAAGAATGGLLGYMLGNHGSSSHGNMGGYGTYGGDYGGDMGGGGGGGYEMSTDFADTVME